MSLSQSASENTPHPYGLEKSYQGTDSGAGPPNTTSKAPVTTLTDPAKDDQRPAEPEGEKGITDTTRSNGPTEGDTGPQNALESDNPAEYNATSSSEMDKHIESKSSDKPSSEGLDDTVPLIRHRVSKNSSSMEKVRHIKFLWPSSACHPILKRGERIMTDFNENLDDEMQELLLNFTKNVHPAYQG